jgi:hypothetical protein
LDVGPSMEYFVRLFCRLWYERAFLIRYDVQSSEQIERIFNLCNLIYFRPVKIV